MGLSMPLRLILGHPSTPFALHSAVCLPVNKSSAYPAQRLSRTSRSECTAIEERGKTIGIGIAIATRSG